MRNTSRCFDRLSGGSHHGRFVVLLLFLTWMPIAATEAQHFLTLDTNLFRSINGSQSPQSGFFDFVDAASGPTFVAVPLLLFGAGIVADQPALTQAGVLVGATQLLAGGSAVLLKAVVGRPRPFVALEDVNVRRRSSASGSSFPSGHTALAFALATAASLQLENPYVSLPIFIWAGAVGYGRIYLGLHYPSDVVGGILIGVASAYFVWHYRDEIHQFVDTHISLSSAGVPVTRYLHAPSVELLRIQFHVR